MKYSLLAILTIALFSLPSCKNGGFSTTKSGLQYNIHLNKGGRKLKEGDYFAFHIVVKNAKDSAFENSYDPKGRTQGKPELAQFTKPAAITDLMEAFSMLGEGDSATFRINSDSVYKAGSPRPPFIKVGENINLVIKMMKFFTPEEYKKETDDRRASYMKKMQELQDEQLKKDDAILQEYFKKNNLQPKKADAGFYYIIDKPGTGDNIKTGDSASVDYAGTLMDGTGFDASTAEWVKKYKIKREPPYRPYTLAVGVGSVIRGWDQGLLQFKKGSTGKLFIPSALGYGMRGNQGIPPNANLIFDISVVNVRHNAPSANDKEMKIEMPANHGGHSSGGDGKNMEMKKEMPSGKGGRTK